MDFFAGAFVVVVVFFTPAPVFAAPVFFGPVERAFEVLALVFGARLVFGLATASSTLGKTRGFAFPVVWRVDGIVYRVDVQRKMCALMLKYATGEMLEV